MNIYAGVQEDAGGPAERRLRAPTLINVCRRCGWESLKSVTLGNVTMSHRTREARRMPCVSLPLNYDRSAARARELVHSLQMYCKLFWPGRRCSALSCIVNARSCTSMDVERFFYSFESIDVNFNPVLGFDSDPSQTFDSDPVPTLVFDPSPVLNFDLGPAFDSDPGPVLDSNFYPAFNSDSAMNYSSHSNEAGG
ncbi:hypothetical protein EVAR_82347_1 [Eumeta japonica]|uniref:Uncharacterized protein n=1 Tax=Eumeta variegata TaxID=151549 RepID=A0A4C1U9R5_EUMVA|nr:hypothetical protein EVAR_82347_1 [Eumeta japonica]